MTTMAVLLMPMIEMMIALTLNGDGEGGGNHDLIRRHLKFAESVAVDHPGCTVLEAWSDAFILLTTLRGVGQGCCFSLRTQSWRPHSIRSLQPETRQRSCRARAGPAAFDCCPCSSVTAGLPIDDPVDGVTPRAKGLFQKDTGNFYCPVTCLSQSMAPSTPQLMVEGIFTSYDFCRLVSLLGSQGTTTGPRG